MENSSYLIMSIVLSIFAGVFFYLSYVKQNKVLKEIGQFWNHAVCFFIGVFGILYYFAYIRYPQIKSGTFLSLSDVALLLILATSSMGQLPYFITFAVKGAEGIISKVIRK